MTGNDTLTGYTPPKRRAPAVTVSGICLAAAAVCLILSALGIGWRGPLQLIAAAAAVTAIEMTTRFILTEYTYTIIYGNEGIDFAVSRPNGKNIKTVANIAMTTVKALAPNDKISALESRFGRIKQSFNYSANMFPIRKGQLKNDPDAETKKYALVFDFNGATDLMIIECTEEFANQIRGILKKPEDTDLR